MIEEAAIGTKYKPRAQPVERVETVYIPKAQAKSVAARSPIRPIHKAPIVTEPTAPIARGRTLGRVLRRVGTYDPNLAHAELPDRIILNIEQLDAAQTAINDEFTPADAAKYLAEEDTTELDKLPPLVTVDRLGRARSRSRSRNRKAKPSGIGE